MTDKVLQHSRYHITALARGLIVLDLLSRRRSGLAPTEIATVTGWTITTAFRVVSTLCQLGYLAHDKQSGRYNLTYSVLLLGYNATLDLDLPETAYPILRKLYDQTHESIFLSVLVGQEIISTVRFLRSERFGALGDRFPAHATPNGKMLLACLPADQLNQLLAHARWAAFTPKTLVTPEEILKSVVEARARGYAVTDDELVVGTRGIAAPVFDADGQCVAAISIVCAGGRLTLSSVVEKYRDLVCATAGKISLQLKSRYTRSWVEMEPTDQ